MVIEIAGYKNSTFAFPDVTVLGLGGRTQLEASSCLEIKYFFYKHTSITSQESRYAIHIHYTAIARFQALALDQLSNGQCGLPLKSFPIPGLERLEALRAKSVCTTNSETENRPRFTGFIALAQHA